MALFLTDSSSLRKASTSVRGSNILGQIVSEFLTLFLAPLGIEFQGREFIESPVRPALAVVSSPAFNRFARVG